MRLHAFSPFALRWERLLRLQMNRIRVCAKMRAAIRGAQQGCPIRNTPASKSRWNMEPCWHRPARTSGASRSWVAQPTRDLALRAGSVSSSGHLPVCRPLCRVDRLRLALVTTRNLWALTQQLSPIDRPAEAVRQSPGNPCRGLRASLRVLTLWRRSTGRFRPMKDLCAAA